MGMRRLADRESRNTGKLAHARATLGDFRHPLGDAPGPLGGGRRIDVREDVAKVGDWTVGLVSFIEVEK